MMPLRPIKQAFHDRYMALALVQMGLSALAVLAATALRFIHVGRPGVESIAPLAPKVAAFSLVLVTTMYALGMYQRFALMRTEEMAVRVVAACGLTWAGLALLYYLLPGLYLGRGIMALTLLFVAPALLTTQILFQRWGEAALIKPRVLVLGAGQRAADLFARLGKPRGSRLVGFMPLSADQLAETLPGPIVRVATNRLDELARRLRVDEIVVAPDERRGLLPLQALLECRALGIRVTDAIGFAERETGKVFLDLLQPAALVYTTGGFGSALYPYGKRVFDTVAAMLLLGLVAPFMVLAALAIRVEDGLDAPVFYRQIRTGRGGHAFSIWKFRSMSVDAERSGVPVWAQRDDPRVTRVGRILRKYRIDELPQLFNVLRGEMSLVGPRPERPEFVAELARNIPFYDVRHRIAPGLTGWAQLNYRYGDTEADAREKLQYDLYYLKHQSLLFDLMICLLTVEVVLFGKGAR
ncbi:MAG TPA: sugar transferase [Gammaproteobacteria bacterium]|jgi:sugar transferase (PEP-CTERM system associated)|uniref:TIGR03013 family PEP-CTERM/XrtA system glycosyltransferase n=1 Tax=Candidatus Macondimonas diazotrophica TaxID=2305248 RepID=A0A4Z0F7U6_9GAMM|nr:TIGR03013 family PEP-CTERM/XrtA system glycosyltransferase [Candidatus Macondimonas diazotrophica]HBG30124.1 sugar transferase [Gammaproteobacteria bacterium]HBG51421.1 sugar transferase [Gammaproteobacteria bacterium]